MTEANHDGGDRDDTRHYPDPGAAYFRVSEALKQLRIVREDDTAPGTADREAINRAVEATEAVVDRVPEPDEA